MRYPLAKPYIGKAEERAVLRVLRSGVLALGPECEAFEKAFARYIGTRYACAVSSGTAGLHLAFIAAGIKEGDEVITTPFSFVASANAILYLGARPVFVDIEPRTYNIDPKKIAEKVTKKTKAILAVHIFGQSADMEAIMKIAKKHNLKVIEDACESLGAEYAKGIKGRKWGKGGKGENGKGKMVGTFGESAVFAFYPNKQMTTGEGGMIVTNDKKKDALFRSLRNQGRAENRQWLAHERLGYNYRMDEMSAAVGCAQLEKIRFLIRERERIAGWYEQFLSPYAHVVAIPRAARGNTHTWFVYVVLLKNKEHRGAVIERLAKRGIATKPYLPSIHLFPFYRTRLGYQRGDFPVSESVSDRALALPFYIGLTQSDVIFICKKLLEVVL